jgi:hypothetical protein
MGLCSSFLYCGRMFEQCPLGGRGPVLGSAKQGWGWMIFCAGAPGDVWVSC